MIAMQCCIVNIASKGMTEQLGKDVPSLSLSLSHQQVVSSMEFAYLFLQLHSHTLTFISNSLSDATPGVKQTACSLLEELAHINSLGFNECVLTSSDN